MGDAADLIALSDRGHRLRHIALALVSLREPALAALLLCQNDLSRAREYSLNALGFKEEWSVHGDAGSLSRWWVRIDTVLMLDSWFSGNQPAR